MFPKGKSTDVHTCTQPTQSYELQTAVEPVIVVDKGSSLQQGDGKEN